MGLKGLKMEMEIKNYKFQVIREFFFKEWNMKIRSGNILFSNFSIKSDSWEGNEE